MIAVMNERQNAPVLRIVAACTLACVVACRDASAPNAAGTRTCSAAQVTGKSLEGVWIGQKDAMGKEAGELRITLTQDRFTRTMAKGAQTQGVYAVSKEGTLTARANGIISTGAYPLKAWIGNGGDCMYFDGAIVWRQAKL
jgi:hypothetical protein